MSNETKERHFYQQITIYFMCFHVNTKKDAQKIFIWLYHLNVCWCKIATNASHQVAKFANFSQKDMRA